MINYQNLLFLFGQIFRTDNFLNKPQHEFEFAFFSEFREILSENYFLWLCRFILIISPSNIKR